MENQSRRQFIKIAGTTLLVSSSISVFGLVSSSRNPKRSGTDFFSDGYYDDGYYDDGYYEDGYYNDGYYDDGYSTGLNSIGDDRMRLFITPNPSRGNFELMLNSKITEASSIHIHDLSGKTFFQEKYNLQKGINRIAFESNELPAGIYELSLVTSKGVAGSARLVIIK